LRPEIEGDDVIGDRHHEPMLMLDQQHRHLALVANSLDQVAESMDSSWLRAAGRFVEQQDLRIAANARPVRRASGYRTAGRTPVMGDALEIEIARISCTFLLVRLAAGGPRRASASPR